MRKIVRRPLRPGVVPPIQPGVQPGVDPADDPETSDPASASDNWADGDILLPRAKRLVSLRIDADILDYFQSGGKGYQTRMNAVLRAFMEARKRRHTP